MTRGAYAGAINPAQGTLQGWSGVLSTEMIEVQPKTADLASLGEADLAALARLVLADAPERSYAIEGGVVRVPRFHAIDTYVGGAGVRFGCAGVEPLWAVLFHS